jgi:hypothetical protein
LIGRHDALRDLAGVHEPLLEFRKRCFPGAAALAGEETALRTKLPRPSAPSCKTKGGRIARVGGGPPQPLVAVPPLRGEPNEGGNVQS